MLTAFIADDEIWIIRGLQKLLSKTGYDVTVVGTATDGFAARQGIASLKPDMIFSDIRMPGMTGLELLKLLPEISPHSRLILISGYAEFSYAQEAVQNHAFDYLLKPIKEEELERVVRVLSESKGNRRPPLDKRQEPVIPESMVDNVISEIRKRYAENLSLTELAERNSVSPGRLSTMIKETTITFISPRSSSGQRISRPASTEKHCQKFDEAPGGAFFILRKIVPKTKKSSMFIRKIPT